jgi:hypothetical protein
MWSYKLDELTPDDILYQIYGFREWFLYLTEDEHLQKTAKTSWGKTGLPWHLTTHHLGDFLLVLVLLLLLARIC